MHNKLLLTELLITLSKAFYFLLKTNAT